VLPFLVLFIVILAMQEKFEREGNSVAVCVWTVMAATNISVHGWKIIETTMFLEHKKNFM
jgi:hypothetical protein